MTLSPRQRDVLAHIADGLRIKQSADRLGIEYNTARSHAAKAKNRLGAKSAAHAVAIALRKGLIQ